MNRNEHGFTLIELLITVSLTGIIIGALAGGILAYMRTATATADRLSETPQIQVASTYFASDVQSSETVDVAPPTCAIPGGSRVIGHFTWTDPQLIPDTLRDLVYEATYLSTVMLSTTQKQLEVRRVFCSNGGAAQSTTLINLGNPGAGFEPRLSCDLLLPCRSTTPPKIVELSLHLCTARANGACRDDDIPVALKGQRRSQ